MTLPGGRLPRQGGANRCRLRPVAAPAAIVSAARAPRPTGEGAPRPAFGPSTPFTMRTLSANTQGGVHQAISAGGCW